MGPCKNLSQRGTAILELALVLPLLAGVALFALEASRAMKNRQVSVVLGREAANVAMRLCVPEIDVTPGNSVRVNACLQRIREDLLNTSHVLFRNSDIVLSIYRYEPVYDDDGVIQYYQYTRPGYSEGRSHVSRFGIVFGRLTGGLSESVLESHRVLVVAETFVPFISIVDGISGIYSFAPKEFYHAYIL